MTSQSQALKYNRECLGELIGDDQCYEIHNCGSCLGDLVPDGSVLQVDPTAEIEIGSIIAVVIKREGPFQGFARSLSGNALLGVTKIFMGRRQTTTGENVYIVGQLSPPLISPIPEAFVEAMHLVVGGNIPDTFTGEMTANDKWSIDLLGPYFTAGDSCPPVNPEWKPQY